MRTSKLTLYNTLGKGYITGFNNVIVIVIYFFKLYAVRNEAIKNIVNIFPSYFLERNNP
jgi:putative cell wall-binding protein